MPADASFTSQLPAITLAAVEEQGWDYIEKHLAQANRLVVMSGGNAEAVVVSVPEYLKLVRNIQGIAAAPLPDSSKTVSLQTLRERFDKRLASLHKPDAT
ncbi:hypothetical protein [Pollutimonas harenae]|uniref:Uncharacterized protein n=1 Tax=Pollutimonas harenae TaxID=657015 RepID=A0A853GS91_9BURK|nr:hypothetical protein [Pollutimonas harenae]NYT85027.1 hypothetical protein [Pollutimonas harenae]TEA72587.1 hypothetical protein ERD84_01355 [Pollutimonas harenae]